MSPQAGESYIHRGRPATCVLGVRWVDEVVLSFPLEVEPNRESRFQPLEKEPGQARLFQRTLGNDNRRCSYPSSFAVIVIFAFSTFDTGQPFSAASAYF